jgi:hypothetical protein
MFGVNYAINLFSVAVRKKEISGEEAEELYQSSMKFSKENSVQYCGMRKQLQTSV